MSVVELLVSWSTFSLSSPYARTTGGSGGGAGGLLLDVEPLDDDGRGGGHVAGGGGGLPVHQLVRITGPGTMVDNH